MKWIIIAILTPCAAFAHVGDHAEAGFLVKVQHLVSQPDHLTTAAMAVSLVAAVAVLRMARAK